MDRQATISIALGSAKFQLERFDAVERLSEPFVIQVEGFSADEVDFLSHLGKPVSLDLGDLTEHVRYYHGRLVETALLSVDGNGVHYRLTLRPWFYLLSQNRNYRIFQEKSVVEIAKKVFADLGVKDVDFSKLTRAYTARDYCVQYKESDFNFLSRLFEDEGIYYYFEHEQSAHKLVLCDGKSAHKAAAGYETVPLIPATGDAVGAPETLYSWSERLTSASQATVTFRAYDFTKPQEPVTAEAQAASQHPDDSLELYDYLDDFTDKSVGAARGKTRLAAARAQRRVFHGAGDVIGLACGGLFTLSKAKVSRFNREYLIIGLHHRVEVESQRTGGAAQPGQLDVEAIASDTLFRPPLVTPKPVASGVETATVTGPSGEVIYVDEHGRVKVRFHWDRSPDEPGKTSCWMRVSHHAAGEGFGNVDLPRVGQEVVVDFLNGDPDRPIITGRVYNAQRKHAYGLPDNRTRSLWRTQTVGDAGSYDRAESQPPSGKGFNEIRLEDKGGAEEVYVHAQRNMLTQVLLDDELKVLRDRKTRVGRDRETKIKHDEKLTVETGDETHEVSKGKRTTTIQQDDALTVKVGDYSMKVELGQVTIEAMKSITLKVGTNSVVIDQAGVTVKGTVISSEAQTVHQIKGSMTQIEGSAMTTVKGGVITLN